MWQLTLILSLVIMLIFFYTIVFLENIGVIPKRWVDNVLKFLFDR